MFFNVQILYKFSFFFRIFRDTQISGICKFTTLVYIGFSNRVKYKRWYLAGTTQSKLNGIEHTYRVNPYYHIPTCTRVTGVAAKGTCHVITFYRRAKIPNIFLEFFDLHIYGAWISYFSKLYYCSLNFRFDYLFFFENSPPGGAISMK